MYYDNWSEKSFNMTGKGYCICPHCRSKIENIRDPSETDMCPICNNRLFEPPENYNIWKYNGTRKLHFEKDIPGMMLVIGTLLLFAICAVLAFTQHNYMAGLAIAFIDITVTALIITAIIPKKIGKNVVIYKGTIIGESYATGTIAYTEPKHRNPNNTNSNFDTPTLFVRYTVLYTKNDANALSYVYEIARYIDFHVNDTVNVNIKNDNQIWLS